MTFLAYFSVKIEQNYIISFYILITNFLSFNFYFLYYKTQSYSEKKDYDINHIFRINQILIFY